MALYKLQATSYKLQDSFTLVELVVVIGILAILTAAAVVMINPGEQLKQSRDMQRISDLKNIQTVIEKYKYSENRVGSLGSANTIYISIADPTSPFCAGLNLPTLASGWTYSCVVNSANLQKIDGTGWIPINLSNVGLIPALPIDPTNSSASNLYYSYIVNSSGQFELTSTLESQKKLKDTALKDGGTDPARYETGETVALWTQASGLVGWWPFDEGSGTVSADKSLSGANFVVLNKVNWIPGDQGGAIQMASNISTGCVNDNAGAWTNAIPSSIANLPSSSFSVSWWSSYNGGGRWHLAPTITTNGCGNCSLWNLGSYIWINDANQNNYTLSYTPPGSGWHYYNFVFDLPKSKSYIYIDGNLKNQGVLNPTQNYGSIQWLSMGVYHPGCVDAIPNDTIDDFRLYNKALSATEIQNMYNATR